jgi:hypothetical protein
VSVEEPADHLHLVVRWNRWTQPPESTWIPEGGLRTAPTRLLGEGLAPEKQVGQLGSGMSPGASGCGGAAADGSTTVVPFDPWRPWKPTTMETNTVATVLIIAVIAAVISEERKPLCPATLGAPLSLPGSLDSADIPPGWGPPARMTVP